MRKLYSLIVAATLLSPVLAHANGLSTKVLKENIARAADIPGLNIKLGRAANGSSLRPFTSMRGATGPAHILLVPGPRGTVDKLTGAVTFTPLNF
jgi:hypothetical protein